MTVREKELFGSGSVLCIGKCDHREIKPGTCQKFVASPVYRVSA